MNKLLIMTLTSLFVAILACVPFLSQRDDDYVYKGQSQSVWIAQVTDPDVEKRREAVEMLIEMGDSVKDAVPALVTAASDEDARVRFLAIRALSIIDPKGKDAMPTIAKAMNDKDRVVSREAIRASMYSVRPDNAPPVGTFISQ